MSFVEELAAERKARRERLGWFTPIARPVKPAPVVVEIRKPQFPYFNVQENYYHQMWFYELITTPNIVRSGNLKLAEIQAALCEHFETTKTNLISKRRNASIVRVRHIGYYLCRKHTPLSLPQIGSRFGLRDHTTVMHGIKKIENSLTADDRLRADIRAIERKLGVA